METQITACGHAQAIIESEERQAEHERNLLVKAREARDNARRVFDRADLEVGKQTRALGRISRRIEHAQDILDSLTDI